MVNNLVIPKDTPEDVKQAYLDMVEKAKDSSSAEFTVVCAEEDWELVKSILNKG